MKENLQVQLSGVQAEAETRLIIPNSCKKRMEPTLLLQIVSNVLGKQN